MVPLNYAPDYQPCRCEGCTELKRKQAERKDAERLVRYMRLLRLQFCHVPNEGNRTIQHAQAARRQGLTPGVPDYLIFDVPPFFSCNGVAIELKAGSGTASVHQRAWIEALRERNWIAEVLRVDEAIELLRLLYSQRVKDYDK
jgi:hypothetical protein